MMELLKQLCEIPGISGREERVRTFLMEAIGDKAQCKVDALGNLLVHKEGKSRGIKRVLLDAHMDEAGFLITHVDEEGFLRFTTVGGIDSKVLLGKHVLVGDNLLPGVIASKPIHMLKADERDKAVDASDLRIDIGASSKEQAEQVVHPGDMAVWYTSFEKMGNLLKGRALDNRAGCAMLLKLVLGEVPYDLDVVFSVQEEIGLHGAKTAAFARKPDLSIVVDTTTAADLSGVPEEKKVCRLGSGPAISFMDLRTMYDKSLYDAAFSMAKRLNIPCQPKASVSGGNNAGAIHQSGTGVRTLALSTPCRYLHSPAGLICEDDLTNGLILVRELSAAMASGQL